MRKLLTLLTLLVATIGFSAQAGWKSVKVWDMSDWETLSPTEYKWNGTQPSNRVWDRTEAVMLVAPWPGKTGKSGANLAYQLPQTTFTQGKNYKLEVKSSALKYRVSIGQENYFADADGNAPQYSDGTSEAGAKIINESKWKYQQIVDAEFHQTGSDVVTEASEFTFEWAPVAGENCYIMVCPENNWTTGNIWKFELFEETGDTPEPEPAPVPTEGWKEITTWNFKEAQSALGFFMVGYGDDGERDFSYDAEKPWNPVAGRGLVPNKAWNRLTRNLTEGLTPGKTYRVDIAARDMELTFGHGSYMWWNNQDWAVDKTVTDPEIVSYEFTCGKLSGEGYYFEVCPYTIAETSYISKITLYEKEVTPEPEPEPVPTEGWTQINTWNFKETQSDLGFYMVGYGDDGERDFSYDAERPWNPVAGRGLVPNKAWNRLTRNLTEGLTPGKTYRVDIAARDMTLTFGHGKYMWWDNQTWAVDKDVTDPQIVSYEFTCGELSGEGYYFEVCPYTIAETSYISKITLYEKNAAPQPEYVSPAPFGIEGGFNEYSVYEVSFVAPTEDANGKAYPAGSVLDVELVEGGTLCDDLKGYFELAVYKNDNFEEPYVQGEAAKAFAIEPGTKLTWRVVWVSPDYYWTNLTYVVNAKFGTQGEVVRSINELVCRTGMEVNFTAADITFKEEYDAEFERTFLYAYFTVPTKTKGGYELNNVNVAVIDGNEVVLKDDQEVAGGTEYKVKVAENPTGSQTFSVNVLINDAPANVIDPVNVRATYTGKDPEPEPEPGFHKVYGVDFTKESALDYLVMKNVYNDDYTVMTWKNVVREGFWTLEEGKGYRPVNTDASWTYLTKEISSLVKEGKKYVLKVTATNVQIAACQGNTNASQDAVNQGWMNEYEITASETKEFTFTAGAASEEGYFFAVIPTAFNLGDRFTAYTYPSDEALYPYVQAIELWEEGAAPAGPAINVEYVSLPDVNKAIVTVVPTRDDTDVYYSLNGEPSLYEGPVTLPWMEALADPETGETVYIFEAFETEAGTQTVVAQSSKEIRIAKPATIGISIEYVALPEMSKAVVTLTPSVDGHMLGYSFDGEEYMGYEGPVTLAWMESRVKDKTGDAVYEFYAAEMDGEGATVATLYREIRVPKPVPSEWEEVRSAQLPLPQAYDEDTWSLYPAANWTVDEDGLTASDDFDWVRAGYVTLEPGVYRIKVRGNDNAKNVLFEIVDCERPTGTSGSFNDLEESITRTSFNSDEDTWVYSNEFTIYETSDCRAQITVQNWPEGATFNVNYIGYEKKIGVEPQPEPEIVYETTGASTRAYREGVVIEGKHINVGKEVPVAVYNDKSIALVGWLGDEDTALKVSYDDSKVITGITAYSRSSIAVGEDGEVIADCGVNEFGYAYAIINYGSFEYDAFATSDNTDKTGYVFFKAKFFKDEDVYDEAYYCIAWPVVEVEGVSFDCESMEIVKGSIVNLEEVVSVNPEDATDNFLTWSSDNEDVATVDENGNVTAVGEGKANITVTVGGKTATIPVVVTDPSGVEELDVDVLYLDENEVVYNILGQQVTSKHKGIVILRDGRKVVIRRK